MTPERWRQIDDLYHAARERGPEALAHADPDVRREVESLLAQDTAGMLDRPPAGLLSNPTPLGKAAARPVRPNTPSSIEMASVLFMDIVGFSRNPLETQRDALHRLQDIVRGTDDYRAAEAAGDLIKLPTGDGMALVFSRDPLAPVRCAVQTQSALRGRPDLPLRTGINSGPVFRHSDILENTNVVGGGINMAQRVMDCGDAGHILLSRQVAEVLEQTSEWAPCLRDLGTVQVKHGVELHIFNLVTAEAGNPHTPSRISGAPAPTPSAKTSTSSQPNAASFAPGSKVGPYEIVAPIGRGGMGSVFRARDPRLGRDVAIKVGAEQFTSRSEREARAIAALNHPNVCQIHDVGPNYLVMEFIEGTTPRGPLPPAEAVKLALGIAAGLEAAHEKGITHRDLKPANILITRSGVKLLDFGLASMSRARAEDDQTATQATIPGTVLGTAGYMSPEQAQGRPADARSDIFSFGLVLYELLSGRRPFTGASAIAVMAAIVRDEPAPLNAPVRIAETVARCLRKAPGDRFQTMAEVRAALEAIDEPVGAPVRAEEPPSIAVLPFANRSGDKEQEYFSDGLAEEILNLLAKIPGLRVIARTSSFAFRGREEDIRVIAEALGVRVILEGSVRRAGNRVRVTAQLIEAENGSQLWSERYDRDLTDVFEVQDEIGRAISEALKVRLAPRTRVVNIEAWEHTLKGVHHRARNSPDAVLKARDHFERALAIDPNYPQAWSGLALCYYVLGAMGARPVAEMMPLVNSAVEKALAIDPSDCDSHTVLAVSSAVFNYDWEKAGKHYQLSITCENVSPRAWFCHGFYDLVRKRPEEAIEHSRLAVRADPLSMLFHSGLTWSLFCAGKLQECIDCSRRALEINPDSHLILLSLGFAQMYSGLAAEAAASFSRFVELAPWHEIGPGCRAAAHWLSGDRDRARELARQFPGKGGLHYGHAIYYATTGEADAMFEALDSAYEHRDYYMPSLPYLVTFDPYRGDPRFRALLARMNLA